MPYQIKLPDGSLAWIADNVPQSKALELAKQSYPDAFPPPPGVVSQLLSAPKEFVKGAASGLVQAVGGLGALPYAAARYVAPELKPFAETGFGQAITGAEQYLAPSDEGAITQVAGGLGSFASILGPQVALRGLGAAGRFAGMAPRAAAPVAVAQTAGLGAEEARQRVEIARGDQIDVTPGQELAALATGVPIGLTELLPVEKLFRGLDKTLSGAVKLDIANYIKRGLAQGGIEGAQEAASGLLQDLSAKGIYNPNLEVGQSMLGDAALGGSVGFIAQTGLDFLLRKDIGRAYQAKVARDNQKTLNDRLEQMQREKDAQLEQTRKNLNLPDSNILALPAPSPKIEVEGKVDPLMNPVGFVKPEELSPEHLKHINNVRKQEGKKPLNQFSVEDLADAGAPQQELDRILTFKTGYDGRTQLSAQDVLNIAAERNVDTSTVGFLDFLRRSTGAEDLNNMSQPQLFSAFKAIDSLAPGQATQILPPGTNATRFSEDQYNKAMTGLAAEIPKNNMMSRDQAVEAIKQYTGLETDRDAESLLQTAIRSGDYTTVNRTVYELGIPGDPTSPPVRRYTTREAAENAAQRLGLEVRERTHQDVALPGKATQLPGGPDIREGSFKQGVAPAGFEIRSPDAVLQTATTQEEADAKADRLQQLRAQKANGYLGEIAKKNELMQKSQRKLESMEADGKTNTLEYKKMAAGVAAQNKRLQNEIDALKAKVQSYTAPLEIAPKGQKPVARTGFTLFEQNQPVATFPSQQAAEEAAISRLPDETLQNIVKLAPSQKGLMPKRLGKMAEAELRRRRGEEPAGFGVEITGTRAEAEARLAAAGVFTPEFQKAAAELEKKLRPLMDKLGLKDLRLNIMRTIKTKDGQSADGYYLQRLIAIAMDADNPMRTLRHEGIHALKELGAFTPQQWKVLEDRARSEWMGKYDIANRYKGMGLTQDEMLEEAISDAFSDFDQTKAPPGLIGALFNKIKQFMQAFGNAMNGLGFQTAEDVFRAVEAGGLKPIAAEGAATEGQLPKYARKSKKFEQTSDLTPLTVEKAKFQEQELEALIKKIGDRIVGMKSGETLDNVRQAVEKLQSYTAQGLRGRKWYEQSAKAVLDAFNGDPVLAEKFFQIIAITSANTEVAANFTKTTKAWTQFAQGKPIKVGTENENKKIEALLNFGEDWDGRKTNTFYTNLMEAMDGKDSGRSTIDLHMTRMLFDKDAPTDAQYELAENMVRLLASKLNVPARQVQAASWVTQKAKTIFEEYRKKGWKKDLNDLELRQFAFERAAADYSHLMKAKVSALPVTDAMKELSSSIRNRVQTITGEVIPSVQSEMSQVEAIEFDAKDKLTKSIAKQNFIPNIAEALNLTSKVRVTVGSGAYQSKVNPNLIVQLVNPDPDVLKKEALDLANAMSYVFKQDATPFFRADPALVDTGQLGFRLRFDTKTLTPAQQKKILTLLNGKFGADAGFTRVRGNEIVLINFRGEDGQPFLTSDAEFVNGLAELRPQIENIAKLEAQEVFGAESEYPYHDWKSDPVGTGIVQGIYSRGPQRPDLQRRLDSIRESFTERARDAVAETGRDPKFSLRPTEPVVRPSTEGDGISIGERQPGAMTFDGVHYSNTADVPVLFGRRYGSGIRGAEAKRLQYADPRIKNRVYFYIPRENGVMPIPEAGLGGHVYIQRLNNMLGPGPEMSRIMREAMGDSNNFESGVVDAGYDGYAVPSMGMMVVLNNDVPVQYRGTRDQIRQKPDEEKVQIGDRRYALRQTNTPEFKKWFGKSTIVDDEGKPKVMYHGTARDITEFRPKQAAAIFVTDYRDTAASYSQESAQWMADHADEFLTPTQKQEALKRTKKLLRNNGYSAAQIGALEADQGILKTDEFREAVQTYMPSGSNVMPLYVRAEKIFDFDNPKHVQSVVEKIPDLNPEDFQRTNNWTTVESPKVQAVIKAIGFDSFYVNEHGIKNLAVYDPNQIKSAIGNIGTFARDNNDIRYALALKNLDPDSPIVPTEGGNPDGSMGLMPERLNGKPIRMLIGMHNDLIPERDNEKLSKPVSFGANHILNRVLNDPKRMPAGAEELLEKIARTAQRTAQNYNAIYKDGSKFILYDGKNSLIVSPGADEMSIVTMYTQENPNRRYGNPVWVGRAPKVAQFLQPLRGTEVIAAGERVGRKPIPVQTKRVYTPSTVETGEAPVAREPRGKLTLKKDVVKYAIRDSLGQDVVDSIERTTTAREEKGFFQRMGEAISPTAFQKLRQGFINKYDAIERLSKDVAEQFGSKELLADTSAIAAALFSDRAAGVAASSYLNGIPVYKDGFTSVSDMDGQVKGLIPILEPLMKYGDPFVFQAFQYYAATRRGKRLDAEGREKLFTPDDVRKGELLGQQYPEFKQVFDEYQKYNKGLVDFMKATGVISPQEAEIWTQNWDYIPFYRQMDGETTAGPNVFSAISGVAKPKKLKGGTAPLADFMETVIRNSRAAIEAGMKNVAAQRVLRDVVRMDQGQAVPAALARGSDIVTVKEEGQTKYYQVDDPLLVEALKGLNLPQLPFVEVLAAPSNLLRNLVTKDPGFILANLIRDSLQAWVTTGTNITPIVDTFKQYGAALVGTSKEAQALERAGLFAGYDFAADVQSSAREVEAELRKRTGQRTAAETAMLPLSKVWELLDKGSSASDVATRSEVYKRTLAETGNEAEALYQAMEVINFSRKGNSALVRILTAVVPFLNARIQGLDVLYRAGFGKAASRNKERMQKAFITRSLTLMGLSWMYWMMASDTEEYRTAEQEVRDNNWIIGSVRIPIPFEIGTVFKVFPERILEYFMGQDTAKDLKESVFRNLTSTLAFNPIPQAILPFVENVTNYSFFTGQPIVGKGLEDVEKKFQIGSTTSLLAQKIGQETGQSPVQIDNLIRGYTGTLGTYAVMAIDAIMRGEGDPTRATMKAEQLPVLKRFFASPEATGTISAYYDLKNAVDQSTRTINFLERSGSGEDLANYLQDKGAKLQAVKPYIQTLSKEMDQLRDLRRMVQLSQMDPDQKRETLDSIRSAEVAMTRRIQQVKKAVD